MGSRPPFAARQTSSQLASHALAARWEQELANWHTAYRIEGKAFVERHHERTKRAKGAPDFGGTLHGGRSVVFDAKFVLNDGKLYWSKVQKHQRESLYNHARMGAVAMVIVRFNLQKRDCAFLVDPAMGDSFVMRPTNGVAFGPDGWWPAVRWALSPHSIDHHLEPR